MDRSIRNTIDAVAEHASALWDHATDAVLRPVVPKPARPRKAKRIPTGPSNTGWQASPARGPPWTDGDSVGGSGTVLPGVEVPVLEPDSADGVRALVRDGACELGAAHLPLPGERLTVHPLGEQ